jgi:branched-chain amino acid transport system permease protein
MTPADFLQQCFNGLSIASIYALVAAGITLVFGLTRLVNFAHGELMILGAYAALLVAAGGALGLLAGLVVAVLVVGAACFVIERGLFRFTLEKPINGFLVSLGLIIVLQNVFVMLWGTSPQSLPPVSSSVLTFGEVALSAQRLFVIAATGAAFLALFLFLNRSRVGLAMRAAAMDRETAGLMAVPVPRLITMTFVLGGVLAAFAGVLLAGLFPVKPTLGGEFVVGLGEAMIAGSGYPEWTDVASFVLMIAILIVRPQGFLRSVEAAP